jgi:hypothetical protein
VQLKENEVFATDIICEYGTTSGYHSWPTFKYCFVDKKNFPVSAKNKRFDLIGSSAEKDETTAVHLYQSLSIDFIPTEIFNEFPNLNGFLISGSNIPILKEGLFTKDFKDILYLSLWKNKIKQIVNNALTNLPKLKWINLEGNRIELIKTNIFKNNHKLEFIGLDSNKIKMIHPSLFLNLNYLIEVWLDNNECADKNFGGYYDPSLTFMNDNLKNCYKNCLNDEECASNVIELSTTMATKTTTTTTKTTELVQPDKGCVSQSKFEVFEKQTMSKFDKFNDCCRIEINKSSHVSDLLNIKEVVCLTKDDKVNISKVFDTKLNQRDEKWSALNESMVKIKSKFNAAVETSKCQIKNEFYEQEISALKEKNALLEKKLEKQREELEKKYKEELANELTDKINKFEIKFQDELKEQYVSIMRDINSLL